jgi:hypothetical protein
MHPTILAKRKADAVGKLSYAAERLAETLDLDSGLIAGLHPVGIHDSLLREMLLLEGAANLITAVAIQAGAITEGVSMETEASEPHWVESAETTPAESEAPAEAEPEPWIDQSKELELLSPETDEAQQEAPAEEERAPKKPAAPRKSTRKRVKK